MNQAIYIQKMKGMEIAKIHRQSVLTMQVLTADVRFAEAEWQLNKSQFWHRTLIRCVCALVEGTLGLFKNSSIHAAEYFAVTLSEDDLRVATERRQYLENSILKTRPSFLPFPDNVKQTLKVMMKAHGVQMNVTYEGQGFRELCSTFELRNRLMHPKGPFDLQVTDAAFETAIRGMDWYDSTTTPLLQKCINRVPISTS